jgi:hypothetical protein
VTYYRTYLQNVLLLPIRKGEAVLHIGLSTGTINNSYLKDVYFIVFIPITQLINQYQGNTAVIETSSRNRNNGFNLWKLHTSRLILDNDFHSSVTMIILKRIENYIITCF